MTTLTARRTLPLALILLAAVTWAQPAPRSCDPVADLTAATDLTAGETVTAQGYRGADDGGGGTFRYDPASSQPTDGGSCFELKAAPGRVLRLVDREADAYAEWFGAYGDGDSTAPHDDHEAINRCLAAYGRVTLRAKVYGVRGVPSPAGAGATYRAIDLGSNYRIAGASREQTTIRLLDGTNPHGSGPFENYFVLLANRDFYESAENVVIRDLTLDCNFDAQDKRTTIHAIGIRGGGALVERVNFRRYGTGHNPDGPSSRECFVVHQTLVYKDASSSRRAGVYRDLDFTNPGHNGMLSGVVGEITHMTVGGANNFENLGWILPRGADPAFDPAQGGENENNWWPAYGGLIENCLIHDEAFDPEVQKSPLNGITYSDCIGVTVHGNRVLNFEGSAVFTMSWWNRDVVITGNQFLKVTTGIALCMQSADAKPVQCPRHENVLIAHNEIETGTDVHAPWGTCAVSLFGGDMPAEVRMKSVHVRENTIRGRAYPGANGARACPLGIKIQITRATYHDLRIEDNLLDFPDFPDAVWIPAEPYACSLMYCPLALWEDATQAGHVVYRGNRNPDGKVLYPFLVGWYFDKPSPWGRQ